MPTTLKYCTPDCWCCDVLDIARIVLLMVYQSTSLNPDSSHSHKVLRWADHTPSTRVT